MKKRYTFVTDDDCHWYLIPAERVEAFELWEEAGPYWDDYDGDDFNNYRIDGGPHGWTFTDPKEDD